MLWSSAVAAQTNGEILKRALWDTPAGDAREIGVRAFREPLTLLRNGVILLGLISSDRWTTEQYQNHLAPIGADFRKRVGLPFESDERSWLVVYDAYAVTGVGALYVAGLLARKPRWQEAGVLTAKAMAESYLVSHVLLKTIFGRIRPANPLRRPGNASSGEASEGPFTRNPWDFFNWHRVYWGSDPNGTAFPSLHIAVYFAAAKVLQRQFDNTWIPYTLGMFPLVYYMDIHNHWVSDMVAGAAIGTFIGNVVFENYHEPAERDVPGTATGRGLVRALLTPSDWSFGFIPYGRGWAPNVRVEF